MDNEGVDAHVRCDLVAIQRAFATAFVDCLYHTIPALSEAGLRFVATLLLTGHHGVNRGALLNAVQGAALRFAHAFRVAFGP